MYIWVGIDVDDAFADLRKKAVEVEKLLGCEHSCYTLPMHVSLKMSFEVTNDRFDEIADSILRYFSTLRPLEVFNPRVENAGNIVWVRYDENKYLCQIKDQLNAMLRDKHGIPMHEYDSDYLFHTTVFMFDTEDKNAQGYRQIANVKLPKKVALNKFVVGSSPNGELGTYSVIKGIFVG